MTATGMGRLPGPEARPRVTVVGDVMLDVFVEGEASRLSPEAPVPVLLERQSSRRPGGAGNVAANLAALGCDVSLVGMIGDDAEALLLADCLEAAGVDPRWLLRQPGRPTSTKSRIVARQQQVVRVDRESGEAISRQASDALAERVIEVAKGAAVVAVADYGKGVIAPSVWSAIRSASAVDGKPIFVDPAADADFTFYAGADLIKPNRTEAERAVARLGAAAGPPRDAGEVLLAATGAAAILVTRGADGMSLFQRGRKRLDLPARRREVFDVTGAGDTVLAVLAWTAACGWGLERGAELANLAGGLAVERFGTSCIGREDLERALAPEGDLLAKLVPPENLAAQGERWRRDGRRVVFTNGCFDLLHVGHLRLLRQCAAFGDVVVVGINADASVRRLKGEGRPILPASDRALMLAALPEVSAVVVFEEDTPAQVIGALRPDVLVKGADYRREDVVGREQVESSGGRLELVPLWEGVSTSEILGRIRGRRGGGEGR